MAEWMVCSRRPSTIKSPHNEKHVVWATRLFRGGADKKLGLEKWNLRGQLDVDQRLCSALHLLVQSSLLRGQ